MSRQVYAMSHPESVEGARIRGPGFRIFRGAGNLYYFWLVDAYGNIVLFSPGYSTDADCRSSIQSLREAVHEAKRYDKGRTVDGKYYFELTDESGSPIARSELHATRRALKNNIRVAYTIAPTAPIDGLSWMP